jgi:hypothetical protein
MTMLHLVASPSDGPSCGQIIFVHGLGGDPYRTWSSSEAESGDCFWPAWLAQELCVTVYTLGYDASPSAWLGPSMPIFDRAKNVLTEFETRSLDRLPIIFICHSLGGILVKEILRQAVDKPVNSWQRIVARTRAVIFLSTPHVGARLATYLGYLASILRLAVTTSELEAQAPALRDLNEWYRNSAKKKLGIETFCFYEKRPVSGVLVVDEGSADPGIEGVISVPLDGNHFDICKPESRESLLYRRIKQIIDNILSEQSEDKSSVKKLGPSKRIFISYRHDAAADQQLAHDLDKALQGEGHEVFTDARLRVGTDWADEISKRIEWCNFFVVLLSARSVQSEMVRDEVRLAHEIGSRSEVSHILPIRVNYDGPLGYELDIYLGHLQYAYWRNESDNQEVTDQLLDAMKTNAFSGADDPHVAMKPLDHAAVEGPRPAVAMDPRVLRAPGGTMRLDDRFYVKRACDEAIAAAANSVGETVIIKAPHQMGKSSLLVRYYAKCLEKGKRAVYLDLQRLSEDQFKNYPEFLQAIGEELRSALNVDAKIDAIRSSASFTSFVERQLLASLSTPATFVFDEVDRLMGRSFQADFFSMLRNWHNSRALPKSGWADLDLALVIATEPYLLIQSADRSPFNVTPPISIEPFSIADLASLNVAYDGLISATAQKRIYELLSGHPYLTRLSFFKLANQGLPTDDLIANADDSDGPFGEHLRACLLRLNSRPELLSAMKQVIKTGALSNEDHYWRLHGAGLVRRDPKKRRVLPSNLLYARFFDSLL